MEFKPDNGNYPEHTEEKEFMTNILDILTMLGEHFAIVVVACVEALIGIVLIGRMVGEKNRKRKGEKGISGAGERTAFESLGNQSEETFLVVRSEDLLPVCAGDNMHDFLGVTFNRLQEDITSLKESIKSSIEANKFWKEYRAWNADDKDEIFKTDFQINNGKWILFTAEKSKDRKYELLVFREVTEIKEMLDDYRGQIAKLENESKSKTTFLSRMSHEIRTPMNGIIGMVTLAEDKLEDTHPAKQYLKKVDELSDHLLSLINDILDMSRIEAGKVELEQKAFSLRELGNRIYNMFAKSLNERGIRYVVDQSDMTADYVIGDELRISQIIINFLSNSVKFTSEGEITVTFRQMLQKDGMVDMMICVHDTGIGMSTEFINRIFRPFEQEGIEISKKYGGTGLGMAITDQLVKLMGGEIVVKSEEGKGSDFSVFLHLPEAQIHAEPERLSDSEQTDEKLEEHYTIRGRRILMAEDNEINAMIGQEILEEKGADVEIVGDGQAALEAYESHPEGYYDCILMDVQMPVMDGREAARKIRESSKKDAKTIPVFALSADAFVEDERLSIESGMNAHFAKPIDFEELEQRVGAFLKEMEKHEENAK